MFWVIFWLVVIALICAYKAWEWWDREQTRKSHESRGEKAFGGFLLTPEHIARPNNGDYKPLGPDVSAVVETAGQIRERVTATRLATLGLFAFAAKKQIDERETYLTVSGRDFEWISALRPDDGPAARAFAAAVNHASKSQPRPS